MRLTAATVFLLAVGLVPGPAWATGDPEDGVPFDHTLNVRFAGKPEFPVTIIIRNAYPGPIVRSFLVPDETPLSIHCRLPPGDYQIESVLTNSSCERYWDDPVQPEKGRANANLFAIRRGGEVSNLLGLPHEFFHQFKIEVLGPKNDFVAGKKPPLLSWRPVDGATYYRVDWVERKEPDKRSERGGSEEVETPFFDFDLELTPGARYEWRVAAYDNNQRTIGFWSPSHFFADEAAQKTFLHPPARLDRGGYLGVLIVETDHPLPGIRVSQVLPGTPTGDAGLQAGDIFTKFAGVPLGDLSVSAFVAIAQSQIPGSAVEVEYARGFSDPQIIPAVIKMGMRPDFAP